MEFPQIKSQTPLGGKFLQLSDGKSVTGVFMGNPEICYRVFEQGKYKNVPEDYPGAKFSFIINIIVKEDDKLVAKLFRGNTFDYDALKQIHEEAPLETIYVKISQSGERQTKRISFMPLMKAKPNTLQLKGVELIPLGKNNRPSIPSALMDDEPPLPLPEDFVDYSTDEEVLPF